MNLNDPLLPVSGASIDAKLTQIQKLLRQIIQQQNGLSTGRVSAYTNAQDTVPTTGKWEKGDFVKNTNPTPIGPVGAQYMVDGWQCIESGEPGVWVEYQVKVGIPPAPAPTATPAPTPAPTSAPSPTSAPVVTTYTQKIQAESATLHGIGTSTEIAGYEGSSHANWFRSGYDEYLEFTFTGAPDASGNLTLRYANYEDQTVTVIVNGVGTMYTFNGSGGTWATKVISGVSFSSGSNTVRLTPEWSGYTFFDWAQFDQLSGSAPAPAPSPAPTPAPSPAPPAPAPAPGSAPYRPFGSRPDPYVYGIKPNHLTNSQMDTMVQSCYLAWRNTRLIKSPAFQATRGIYSGQTITDGYHVLASIQIAPGVYSVCVSEGIGYGMLITVLMAGYDANAKVYFDGLFKVARGRPAFGMPAAAGANTYLHEWRLGSGMSSAGDGYNAADGDLDIALALLMAHRQWGSSGAINYWQEGINTINAMKEANFATNGVMYMPQRVSRVSDYMIGHFRSFKAATGDAFWDNARTNSIALAQQITNNFSPSARLQPGFIYDPLGPNPRPDNVAFVDRSGSEGIYDQNSVRNPWRWATDYIYSGDSGVKTLANDIVNTMKTTSGGSATAFSYQYNLDGSPGSNLYHEKTTSGCLTAGAMVDVAHQTFLNTLFSANAGAFATEYYQSELQLLPLIVASGNWWRP